MNFGRREQVVGLSLGALVLIALLHLLVFAPRAREFNEVFSQMEEAKANSATIVVLRNPRAVEETELINKELQALYNDALTSMSMAMPEAFRVPKYEDLKLDPAVTAGKQDAEVHKIRMDTLVTTREQKFKEQTDLVVEQIRKLLEFDSRRTPNNAGRTQMTFMAEGGWQIPLRLPDGVSGGKLNDLLIEIADTKAIIDALEATQVQQIAQQRAYYEQLLLQLGINNNFYRDQRVNAGLPSMGEFVPLIHKMVHAQLILDALGENPQLAGQPLTRDRLYYILEIHPPLHNMVVRGSGAEMKINEMYFVYEQLRFLNGLLGEIVKNEIAEVFGVRLEDASYLVDMGQSGLPMSSLETEPPPAPTPPPYNVYALPKPPAAEGEEEDKDAPPHGEAASTPGARDIGFAMPIKLQFRASNLSGMKFIYEVTQIFRLAEVDSMTATSDKQRPDAENIWFEVRFIGVPYLFGLQGHPLPGSIATAETTEGGSVQPPPPPGS